MTTAQEALVSMCDERARMLQDQFAVSVNHVHALAVLISTFHYQKNPSAMDQVSFFPFHRMVSCQLFTGYLINFLLILVSFSTYFEVCRW